MITDMPFIEDLEEASGDDSIATCGPIIYEGNEGGRGGVEAGERGRGATSIELQCVILIRDLKAMSTSAHSQYFSVSTPLCRLANQTCLSGSSNLTCMF